MKRTLLLLLAAAAAHAEPLRITLADAETLTLKLQPRVAAARLNARAAQETITEARAAYYPTVVGNTTAVGALGNSRIAAGAINNPSVFNRAAAGINIAQTLSDFGRTSNLVSSSRFRAQARDQDASTAAGEAVLRTDRAFFNVLRAQALVSVAEQTVAARQLVADQISALTRARLKSGLDESFANTNLAEGRLLLSDSHSEVDAAYAEFAATLNAPPGTQFVLTPPAEPGDAPEVAALLDAARRDRPELRAARLDVEGARSFARAEGDLRKPSLTAIGTAGGTILQNPAQIHGTWAAAGVNLSIPIFNGHAFEARRNEAELRAAAAEQQLHALEADIARDVQTAWLAANAARERLDITRQLVEQATLSLDLARARYDLGLGSIVEVTQAQLSVTSAAIAQTNSRYELALERSVLDYASGARFK